jgi:hypothetical protein
VIQERGMDTLSIFTSPSSPGVEILRSLARAVEPYNIVAAGAKLTRVAD